MNEEEIVTDASAILAALKDEPFGNLDPRRLIGATISAVNVCEVLSKLHDDGLDDTQAEAAVSTMDMSVVAFDTSQARTAARLRSITRHAGLSLGDRHRPMHVSLATVIFGRQAFEVVVAAFEAGIGTF